MASDPLDVWIKITPDTLPAAVEPGDEQHVDICIAPYGQYKQRVTRAFYDAEAGTWFSAEDGGRFEPEEVITHYRIGSRPA